MLQPEAVRTWASRLAEPTWYRRETNRVEASESGTPVQPGLCHNGPGAMCQWSAAARSVPRRVQRLPGIPSSNVLLESLTGELDDFGVEAYLGNPSAPQAPSPDLHSQVHHPPYSSTCNFVRHTPGTHLLLRLQAVSHQFVQAKSPPPSVRICTECTRYWGCEAAWQHSQICV